MSNGTNYAVDDEFGSRITEGVTWDGAKNAARRYLSAHKDAPAVTIYEDVTGGESWELSRDEVLS